MKDWFGNEALDFGSYGEMIKKYSDDAFVFLMKGPHDNEGYVLYKTRDHDVAHDWISAFKKDMVNRGYVLFYVMVVDGMVLHRRKMGNFIGGVF